jgi:hypothetical protein
MAFALDDALIPRHRRREPLGHPQRRRPRVRLEGDRPGGRHDRRRELRQHVRPDAGALEAPAAWYINGDLWPQIFQLQQVIGTGGVPALHPDRRPRRRPRRHDPRPARHRDRAGVGDRRPRRRHPSSTWPSTSARKGGIQRASSIHVEFLTDQEVFRWILRTNGAPWRSSAITPYKGSFTLSPFVALAGPLRPPLSARKEIRQ